jgi:hypothetical protein
MVLKFPNKLMMIIWEDSQLGYQGWKLVEEQPIEVPHYVSVGFLIHEDEKCKVLFPHLKNIEDKETISGTGDIVIPVSAILKAIEIPIDSFS